MGRLIAWLLAQSLFWVLMGVICGRRCPAKDRIRCKIEDYSLAVNLYYGAGRKNRSYRD